ncbi:MAG: NusG domain II-containing protein [Spirochaetales bacterium]|nr:NusG domain II-containing protein [Spirochaetales bacterium]MCF7938590.1 NusG domain II-containing protein [Spirochaetales bacterium]
MSRSDKSRRVLRAIRGFDYFALVLAILLTVGLSLAVYGDTGGEKVVRIEAAEAEYVYPLEENRVFKVPGPLGMTKVEISDGEVRVVSSPCREQICVATGEILRAGTFIACVPNRVLIKIVDTGRKPSDTDGVDAHAF